MKRILKLTMMATALLLGSGCARFTTTQIDERTNIQTGETTTITTKASSFTFFDSKSSLAKWKATQSEKSQGAEVGGLDQETSGTNTVDLIRALAEGAVMGAAKSIKP
jgi:hypothetical protein